VYVSFRVHDTKRCQEVHARVYQTLKIVVHTYFKQIDAQKVQCLKCNLALAVKCGSTGTLRNHLQYKHPEDFEDLITSGKDAKQSKCNLASKIKLLLDSFCYVASLLSWISYFLVSFRKLTIQL